MLKWYQETEDQHDVFMAGRIRLVRNLAHYPFPVKLSGEYSNVKFVSGYCTEISFINFATKTASSIVFSFELPKTTSLCSVDVEL